MTEPTHFKGKDALGHVAEAQVQGKITAAEVHGTELPGQLNAATDAARDTGIALALVWILLSSFPLTLYQMLGLLALFSGGWLLWKAGRSAWMGWSRLERLHRVIAQEKWEIEHHRQQERDELRALYAAKGFEGKLLEDVVDVLMADGDRLLRVMVEEEMGYSLETYEHPLQQSLGAAVGVFLAAFICCLAYYLYPSLGLILGAFLAISLSAGIAAGRERNRIIPAVVWNLALSAVAIGFSYFSIQYLLPHL